MGISSEKSYIHCTPETFLAQRHTSGKNLHRRAGNWIHLVARSESGNQIHLPLSQYKLHALFISMSVSSSHSEANKLSSTLLRLLPSHQPISWIRDGSRHNGWHFPARIRSTTFWRNATHPAKFCIKNVSSGVLVSIEMQNMKILISRRCRNPSKNPKLKDT